MGNPPEKWNIIAPRVHERYEIEWENNGLQPACLLFTQANSWSALTRLAPNYAVERSQRTVARASHSDQSNTPNQELSRLESLPAELHCLIIEQMTNSKKDLVALALASPILRAQVIVWARRSSSTPPWMGIEIGCLDIEYHQPLPQWVLMSCPKATPSPSPPPPELEWSAAFDMLFPPPRWPSQSDNRLLRDLQAASSGLPESLPLHVWALRNLTTRQYVRCYRKIGDQQTWVETDRRFPVLKVHGGITNERLSVEDVLIMRFCNFLPQHRTRFAQHHLDGKPSLEEVWAGHRFDTVQFQGQELLNAGFSDITVEVVEGAFQLFERMYSKEIRSVVLKAKLHNMARFCCIKDIAKARKQLGRRCRQKETKTISAS